jgi:hypothetical protein
MTIFFSIPSGIGGNSQSIYVKLNHMQKSYKQTLPAVNLS